MCKCWGVLGAEHKVESQEVTAMATPHVAGREADRPDASASSGSCNNNTQNNCKKISGDHIQPLWGEETSNPYRGYITYLTTKGRTTLVHPSTIPSMANQLPNGASWTGVRRTRGVRDDGGYFGIDDNLMDPNMDIHSVKGKWKGKNDL